MWPPLRAESKIYGMAVLGVMCGLVGCLIVMMFLGVMWSVGGAIPGYFMGVLRADLIFSKIWEKK
jgi:hypothetical protein